MKLNDANAEKISPFACDMSAIEPEKRGEHIATIADLFRAVEAMQELPNGYAFKLPNEQDILLRAAKFIAFERLCCPFFGFAIELAPEGGELWLSLTGRAGVKPFIAAEIGGHLTGSAITPGSFNLL